MPSLPQFVLCAVAGLAVGVAARAMEVQFLPSLALYGVGWCAAIVFCAMGDDT